MSETYRSTFGQQIFTDVSASGNSSGRDRFEMLDATQFYHNDRDYQAPGTLRLSGQDSSYAHGHPFAYASHSGPPSLPSKRTLSCLVFPLHLICLYIICRIPVVLITSSPCPWFVLPFFWVADSVWRHFRDKHATSREHRTPRDIAQLGQVPMQGIEDAYSQYEL